MQIRAARAMAALVVAQNKQGAALVHKFVYTRINYGEAQSVFRAC